METESRKSLFESLKTKVQCKLLPLVKKLNVGRDEPLLSGPDSFFFISATMLETIQAYYDLTLMTYQAIGSESHFSIPYFKANSIFLLDESFAFANLLKNHFAEKPTITKGDAETFAGLAVSADSYAGLLKDHPLPEISARLLDAANDRYSFYRQIVGDGSIRIGKEMRAAFIPLDLKMPDDQKKYLGAKNAFLLGCCESKVNRAFTLWLDEIISTSFENASDEKPDEYEKWKPSVTAQDNFCFLDLFNFGLECYSIVFDDNSASVIKLIASRYGIREDIMETPAVSDQDADSYEGLQDILFQFIEAGLFPKIVTGQWHDDVRMIFDLLSSFVINQLSSCDVSFDKDDRRFRYLEFKILSSGLWLHLDSQKSLLDASELIGESYPEYGEIMSAAKSTGYGDMPTWECIVKNVVGIYRTCKEQRHVYGWNTFQVLYATALADLIGYWTQFGSTPNEILKIAENTFNKRFGYSNNYDASFSQSDSEETSSLILLCFNVVLWAIVHDTPTMTEKEISSSLLGIESNVKGKILEYFSAGPVDSSLKKTILQILGNPQLDTLVSLTPYPKEAE